jgi:hypothetical protein
MKAIHMFRAAMLLVLLLPGPFVAAESKPVSLSSMEPEFQRFLQSLKIASRKRDASFIYLQLASDYYLERDFGGSFDPSASPAKNFSASFPFNNADLAPEYKDRGWREFRRAISGKSLERKNDGQLCVPHGALDAKPYPESQLCFSKKTGKWKIQGQINGGD